MEEQGRNPFDPSRGRIHPAAGEYPGGLGSRRRRSDRKRDDRADRPSRNDQTFRGSAVGLQRMPDPAGITNAHTHSPENMAAGFCDGLQLDDWLKAIWAQLDHMTPDAVRLAVFAGAALMLKRGVTAVVDHFRQTPASLAAIDSARAAYAATGMRAMIAVMLRDRVADNGQMVGVRAGSDRYRYRRRENLDRGHKTQRPPIARDHGARSLRPNALQ